MCAPDCKTSPFCGTAAGQFLVEHLSPIHRHQHIQHIQIVRHPLWGVETRCDPADDKERNGYQVSQVEHRSSPGSCPQHVGAAATAGSDALARQCDIEAPLDGGVM